MIELQLLKTMFSQCGLCGQWGALQAKVHCNKHSNCLPTVDKSWWNANSK